ncbi:MAG: hypothetical protein ACOCT0_00580 [Halobacteriota archaeon]
MNQETEFEDFIKIRLGLLLAVSTVIAVGTIGLINLMRTLSIEAMPLYVHATVGAVVFPLLVFVTEYRGAPEIEAVKTGVLGAAGAVFFVLLLSEGSGRIVDGLLALGVGTLFYVAAVSLVASTLIVVWLQRTYIEPLPRASTPSARRTRR